MSQPTEEASIPEQGRFVKYDTTSGEILGVIDCNVEWAPLQASASSSVLRVADGWGGSDTTHFVSLETLEVIEHSTLGHYIRGYMEYTPEELSALLGSALPQHVGELSTVESQKLKEATSYIINGLLHRLPVRVFEVDGLDVNLSSEVIGDMHTTTLNADTNSTVTLQTGLGEVSISKECAVDLISDMEKERIRVLVLLHEAKNLLNTAYNVSDYIAIYSKLISYLQ